MATINFADHVEEESNKWGPLSADPEVRLAWERFLRGGTSIDTTAEPIVYVEIINATPYLTFQIGDWRKSVNITMEVASDCINRQGIGLGPRS